jgi:uncharacterized protein YdeI (BOF family)
MIKLRYNIFDGMRYIILMIACTFGVIAIIGSGGGSSSKNPPTVVPSTGTVSVFATDNLSDDYSAVWIKLKKITAIDTTGKTIELFKNDSGEVINLKQLNGVGRLINTKSVPVATYNDFDVTLANDVKLIPTAGGEINATLSATSSDGVIELKGELVVAAGQVTGFALDFDLKQFTYDAGTNRVVPVVLFKGPKEVIDLPVIYAKVEGKIISITNTQQFMMRLEDGGPTITVALNDKTRILKESGGIAGPGALSAGQEVDVFGGYNPVNISMGADTVIIDDDDSNTGGGGGSGVIGLAEVEGRVQSWDGVDQLTMSLSESDFYVPNGILTVINISNATFTEGNVDQLQIGVEVEIKGTWDGSQMTAKYVEIDDDNGGPGGGITPPPSSSPISTVAQVRTYPQGTMVTMRGIVIEKLADDDDYLFADDTGSIKLEWEGYPQLPLNVQIEVSGVFDKNDNEVDVSKIKALESVTPPVSGIHKVSEVKQGQYDGTLRGLTVTMQGVATEQLDGDDYIFADETGSIKVEWEGTPSLPIYRSIEVTGNVDSNEVEISVFKEL